MTIADRRAAFRKLHESGCFVIPNPSNVGEAKRLAKLGFKAIASSSAGAAWTFYTAACAASSSCADITGRRCRTASRRSWPSSSARSADGDG